MRHAAYSSLQKRTISSRGQLSPWRQCNPLGSPVCEHTDSESMHVWTLSYSPTDPFQYEIKDRSLRLKVIHSRCVSFKSYIKERSLTQHTSIFKFPKLQALAKLIIHRTFFFNAQTSNDTSLHRGADKSLARPHWKNNWNVNIFGPTPRLLLLGRPGRMDKPLIFFFWVACKS